MKGGITDAKESYGETSSQKSGAREESDYEEGSREKGREKGCFSSEEEVGRLVNSQQLFNEIGGD
jgi:hypothetical protein